MRGRTVVGAALLLVGFLLLGGVIQLAVTPQFYWSETFPDGTEAAPKVLTVNEQITLVASTISNQLPDPQYWKVSVSISWSGKSSGSQTIDMGNYDSRSTAWEYEEGAKTLYILTKWTEPWTPLYDGVTYVFAWKVEAKDPAGNLVNTYIKTTYAKTIDKSSPTPPPAPDGKFEVNDVNISVSPSFTSLNGYYKVEFTPTKNQEYIKCLKVEEINRATSQKVAEKRINKTSFGTYIAYEYLPTGQYGNYELKCYIVPAEGSEIYKGSAYLNYQASVPTPPNPLLQPDGYFTVNGEKVTSGEISSAAEVVFAFVPTQGAENIQDVYVQITNSEGKISKVALQKQSDGTYRAECTAPGYGAYTVNGYITTSSGDIQKMNITLTVLKEQPENFFTMSRVIGVALMGIGAVVLLRRD